MNIEYQRVFHGVRPGKRSNRKRPPGKQDARASKTHVFHVAILHGRFSFLVEKLALLAFQPGKRDGDKVSLFPFYTVTFPPTRKTRHGKHARVK